MKTLPYGAKLEAIKKAMKKGRKFYLHTYTGVLEVAGIDAAGSWALANGRSWAICSTEVDRWYGQLNESQPKLHYGAVCSYCGTTMTEDEYSSGHSNCHGKDVISEEEYQ